MVLPLSLKCGRQNRYELRVFEWGIRKPTSIIMFYIL